MIARTPPQNLFPQMGTVHSYFSKRSALHTYAVILKRWGVECSFAWWGNGGDYDRYLPFSG